MQNAWSFYRDLVELIRDLDMNRTRQEPSNERNRRGVDLEIFSRKPSETVGRCSRKNADLHDGVRKRERRREVESARMTARRHKS